MYRDPIVKPGLELEKVLRSAAAVCDAANSNTEPMREGDMPTVDAIISLEEAILRYGCYFYEENDEPEPVDESIRDSDRPY